MRATDGRLALGTRVRISAPQAGLLLWSPVGTVARPDDDDYYVIRLDEPALYDRGLGGEPEELPEIIELVDNLEVVQDGVHECMIVDK